MQCMTLLERFCWRIDYVRVNRFDQPPERPLEHVLAEWLFTDPSCVKATQHKTPLPPITGVATHSLMMMERLTYRFRQLSADLTVTDR